MYCNFQSKHNDNSKGYPEFHLFLCNWRLLLRLSKLERIKTVRLLRDKEVILEIMLVRSDLKRLNSILHYVTLDYWQMVSSHISCLIHRIGKTWEGWCRETQQALRDAILPPAAPGSFSSSLVFKMKIRGEVTTITFNRLNIFCSE